MCDKLNAKLSFTQAQFKQPKSNLEAKQTQRSIPSRSESQASASNIPSKGSKQKHVSQ